MSTERILIHGSTAQRMATVPALGQIGSDDEQGRVILGDGVTPGGIPMARADEIGSGAADTISYDNTASGLAAENVQDAIDEVEAFAGRLPATVAGDAGKHLTVKPDGSGYELTAAAAAASAAPIDVAPLFIEQLVTGFYGRGMKSAETVNLATEQAVAGTTAAGGSTITCADATNFLAGANVTVKHDNGRYWTYWVQSKAGNVLTISPSLKWGISVAGGARIERTWYSRAHAGKFYLRQLAQRIARQDLFESCLADRGRTFFTQFAANASVADDQMSVVGGAVLSYFAASSSNTTTTNAPVRFGTRSSAYVDFTAAAQGVRSNSKAVTAGTVCLARVIVMNGQAGVQTVLRIMADTPSAYEIGRYVLPTGNDGVVQTLKTVAFRVPKGVTAVRLQIETLTAVTGFFVVNQLEIFPSVAPRGTLFASRPNLKIVVTGDSWVAGDLGTSPEREPLTQQLALELPAATIVNKGAGGAKVSNVLTNFDSYIAAEAPDVAVLVTGVNECYSPFSATFNPDHIDLFKRYVGEFVSRCMSIGVKPIIVGTPALAEADTEGGFTAWALNDRATLQAAYLYDAL